MSIHGTNAKLIHSFEQLEAINSAKTEEERKELLLKYGKSSPLNYLLSMNFHSGIKVDLPNGMPPTTKLDDVTHPDMMHPLHTQITKMRICFVDSKIPKFKKEKVFLDIIEAIPYKEVLILVSCKDKALTETFPNITKELVQEVFPAYVG